MNKIYREKYLSDIINKKVGFFVKWGISIMIVLICVIAMLVWYLL